MGNNTQNTDSRIIELTSAQNPHIKEWRLLLTGRGMKKAGRTIVSGSKTVPEVVRYFPEIVQAVLMSPRDQEKPVVAPSVPIYRLTAELFGELDSFGTGLPLLVVVIPRWEPMREGTFSDQITLVVPFQDPANVGAVLRSAAAFGVSSILLTSESASPWHPKSLRASGPAAFACRFSAGPQLEELTNLPVPLVALDAEGEPISDYQFPDRFALVPGVEGPGLPSSLPLAGKVAIPLAPGVESLNAAVAVSIALYEWRRRS